MAPLLDARCTGAGSLDAAAKLSTMARTPPLLRYAFSGSDFGVDFGPRTPTKFDCKHSVAKREFPMNEEALNLSIRKFLKAVGVGSQRAIEHAVADAAAGGGI